jgi:hypothetical protein
MSGLKLAKDTSKPRATGHWQLSLKSKKREQSLRDQVSQHLYYGNPRRQEEEAVNLLEVIMAKNVPNLKKLIHKYKRLNKHQAE